MLVKKIGRNLERSDPDRMPAEEIKNSPFPSRPSPRTSSSSSAAAMLKESILSPRFRSAAALAGWDEEALLLATLVVEDTPDRQPGARRRKRLLHLSKSPPTSTSTRKRRSRRRPEVPIPPVALLLDDDEEEQKGGSVSKDSDADEKNTAPVCCKEDNMDIKKENAMDEKGSSKELPSMDRLREELSCAICLDICFEPSTTACGHSFCMKCLKCAAAKCGNRCPKCRQLISNGRSCTVNTVLWNTIQLLFPEEVEARKESINREGRNETNEERNINNNSISQRNTRRSVRRSVIQASQLERDRTLRRRIGPIQSEDAALALRLQREEFMVAFQGNPEQQRNMRYSARENLRAMASRAALTRNRDRAI